MKNLQSLVRLAVWMLVSSALVLACTGGVLRVAKAEKRNDAETRRVAGIAKLHDMACKLRLGMSKAEVEHELGKATYSPARGVFYCPVEAEDEA